MYHKDRYYIETSRPAIALADISKDAPRISIPRGRMRSRSLQVPGKLSRLQVTTYRSQRERERPLAAPIVRSARETRTRRRRIHNERRRRRRYKISHARESSDAQHQKDHFPPDAISFVSKRERTSENEPLPSSG